MSETIKIPNAKDLVWEWCDLCEGPFTRCPLCKGNSCAGGCPRQTATEPCPMSAWWKVVIDAEDRGLAPGLQNQSEALEEETK